LPTAGQPCPERGADREPSYDFHLPVPQACAAGPAVSGNGDARIVDVRDGKTGARTVAIRLCAVGALAAIRPDGHRDAPVFGIGSRQLDLPVKAAAVAREGGRRCP